jgi:hypothetical protein
MLMPLSLRAEMALPLRKGDVLSQVANSQVAKAEPEPTAPANAAALQPSEQPAPPPLAPSASGDVSKDPATTYVPGVRRMKPTVPPKPEALQRWLSKL